ncbi:MAG: hypothetical protein WB779_07185 [Ignavibacteriaceae bacterium]
MKKIFLVSCLLSLIILANSQGQVKSNLVVKLITVDGYPLSDQVIKLDSASINKLIRAAITDSNGCVIFNNLFPGEYYVRGGVHGELQATGRVKITSNVQDTLIIIQKITKKYFLELGKE